MNNLTDRLKTHTPSLLPRAEWPISKGPWTTDGVSGEVRIDKSWTCVAQFVNRDNARFIAACNSEPPLVETLWELFETNWHYHENFEEYKLDTKQPMLDNKYLKACLRLLTHLDAMSVIRWTPKDGE